MSAPGNPRFNESIEARLERTLPGATVRLRRNAAPEARYVVTRGGVELATAATKREAVYRAEELHGVQR